MSEESRPDPGAEPRPPLESPAGEETEATAELPAGSAEGPGGPGERGARRRFLRSNEDRVIFGVCGGLAEQFRVDPLVFRLGFAATILFGGVGVFIYLALALLVPADDGTGSPQAPVQRSRTLAAIVGVAALIWLLSVDLFFDVPFGLFWIALAALTIVGVLAILRQRHEPLDGRGVALATLLVLAVACGLVIVAATATVLAAFGHGAVLAGGVIAGGVLLVALALAGRGGRWLIAPLLAIAVGVGTAAAADLDWDGSVGERAYRPATLSAVPAGGYGLGIGRLEVDLRAIDWRRGDRLGLGLDLGVGEAVIGVPEGVCIEARAETEAGELWIAGQRNAGIGVDAELSPPPSPAPRLVLDADVQVGALRVVNDDAVPLHTPPATHRIDEAAAARNEAACDPRPPLREREPGEGER